MSSGSPRSPIGILATCCARISGGTSAVIGVFIGPGMIVFTRTPFLTYSIAVTHDIMRSALLLALKLIAAGAAMRAIRALTRSEEHTSELQSLMRTAYAVLCVTKKKPIEA